MTHAGTSGGERSGASSAHDPTRRLAARPTARILGDRLWKRGAVAGCAWRRPGTRTRRLLHRDGDPLGDDWRVVGDVVLVAEQDL